MTDPTTVTTEPPRAPAILIVDDTPASLQLLAGALANRGYRVRPVLSGKVALQAARAEPPDLVLLDILMPEMNGYEVCAAFKADPALAQIPILFISGMQDPEDKVKAFQAGGVDYVTKPLQLQEVEARVHTHLELDRQRREIERQHGALDESYRRLQETEALRDSLVHLLVHDLRSPLTAISGHLELALMEPEKLDEDVLRYLTSCSRSVKWLCAMVTAILDVSRLEAGQMPIERQAVELRELVGSAVGTVEVLATNHTLEVDLPSEPMQAFCDPGLTERIVVNLVSNAVKHTRRGTLIRVKLEREPSGFKVSVIDNGPGIPPEFQLRIFEKFGQVEGRKSGQKLSSGLGLTYCKLAAEAQGGRIGLVSEEEVGSTFWFSVPDVTAGSLAAATGEGPA
jgi:signal transduction histidine kinase